MKVRCIRLLGSDGTPQESSKWITVGAVYVVLAIEFDRNGQWLLRLLSDNKIEVALFSIDGFEIVSHKLAPSWVVTCTTDGFFQLAPEAWIDTSFWERFYDRDPDAIQSFESEVGEITATS